jgi:hypothetical protein
MTTIAGMAGSFDNSVSGIETSALVLAMAVIPAGTMADPPTMNMDATAPTAPPATDAPNAMPSLFRPRAGSSLNERNGILTVSDSTIALAPNNNRRIYRPCRPWQHE